MNDTSAQITVVDDDPSVRKALSRLISAAGYRASVYESAEEYLQSVERQTDCLVLDVHLPGMTGLELQSTLRRTSPEIPVVFISAFSDQHAQAQAIQDGAVDFLPKPLDSDRLLDAIARAFEAGQPDNA